MKILLLGATGRTGHQFLLSALERGHEVKALVRSAHKLPSVANLVVVEGAADDETTLAQSLQGCEAVVNLLNISRTSDFPWSPLRTPKNFLSTVTGHLVRHAPTHKIKRVISCSAWGVNETRADIPSWFRFIINYSNVGVGYRDHELQENLLMQSDLDWTSVRPVGLNNGRAKNEIRITLNNFPRPSLIISRKTVALFMLDAVEKGTYIRQRPVISNE